MKLKILGTLLLLLGAVMWQRTAWRTDNEPVSLLNVTRDSSDDRSGPDTDPSRQGLRQNRVHTEDRLTKSLDTMGLSISADRIGATSAEGSVRLQGPNKYEVSTEELQVSQSTGDLIMIGPSQLRSSKSSLSVAGEGAILRVNADGSFSSKGETTIEVKTPQK